MYKKLYRSARDGMLGGVAAGIAEYFDIDPIIVRLAFVLFVFAGGAGVIVYLIMWIVVPQAPLVPYNMNANLPPQNQGTSGGSETNTSPGGNAAHGSETQPNTESKNDPVSEYFKTLNKQKEKRGVTIGIILVVLGFFLLANTIFHQIYFHDLFPVALIVLGMILLLNATKK